MQGAFSTAIHPLKCETNFSGLPHIRCDTVIEVNQLNSVLHFWLRIHFFSVPWKLFLSTYNMNMIYPLT